MFRSSVIFLILLFTSISTVNSYNEDQMIQLANNAEKVDLSIEEWQVLMKEKVDSTTAEKIVMKLKNRYKGTIIKDKDIIKYEFRDNHQNGNIELTFHVRIPKKSLASAELIVAIQGSYWNEEIKESYLSLSRDISKKYFTNVKQTFSWMNGQFDGIMLSGLFEQIFTKTFKLQQIRSQFDKTTNETYIYGYTPTIQTKMMIENIPVNLQVVYAKDEKGITNLTIGTPILIHEY